jgi:hypothetical protein
MIRAYSQRILHPFSGVVQIAESERIRALSFDGIDWQIQYVPDSGQTSGHGRVRGYGLDRSYYNVGSKQKDELKTFRYPAFLDHDEVTAGIHELSEYLSNAIVPFPAADIYEYWLLDAADKSPLALIYSCCDESLMTSYPDQTAWTALPHSKMGIDNTDAEQARNEPPVNHRLQSLIANRAGYNPRGAWFQRSDTEPDTFPGLLIREDWHEEADHDVCQRYLMRKAPRLLMLHGLTQDERERMEMAARQHVFEVEEYYRLYPEVNDQKRMSAMRVEAQLRRTAPQASPVRKQDKPSGDTGLSKDMRIFET